MLENIRTWTNYEGNVGVGLVRNHQSNHNRGKYAKYFNQTGNVSLMASKLSLISYLFRKHRCPIFTSPIFRLKKRIPPCPHSHHYFILLTLTVTSHHRIYPDSVRGVWAPVVPLLYRDSHWSTEWPGLLGLTEPVKIKLGIIWIHQPPVWKHKVW